MRLGNRFEIAEATVLRRVWVQNYSWADNTTLRWRTTEEAPEAPQYISSPYDHDARYSQKRGLT
jgi:hypothetical protein